MWPRSWPWLKARARVKMLCVIIVGRQATWQRIAGAKAAAKEARDLTAAGHRRAKGKAVTPEKVIRQEKD